MSWVITIPLMINGLENSLGEVKEFKNDSKKTVNYMVKEFEMKKSADQYARPATSKTGTLDMGALHTYKFNDDLFKKVTTCWCYQSRYGYGP